MNHDDGQGRQHGAVAEQEHDGATPTGPLYHSLTIHDPEVVAAVAEYPSGPQRNDFVNTCLKIGVLSLRAARGLVDGESIRREGDHLIATLTERLNSQRDAMLGGVGASLTHYFDPSSGLFTERMQRLVKDDGEIAGVMQEQMRQAQTGLTTMFERFVGENSDFFKLMAPDESNVLLAAMRKTVDEVLQAERAVILGQFSLDAPDSALSRLVRDLTRNHGEIGEALRKDMGSVVHEFSLDNKEGALSRLVGRVEDAQARISKEFSLDHEGSVLSRMRREMHDSLEKVSRNQREFQQEVVQLLQKMQSRKEEAAKSTLHGAVFEEAVGHRIGQWAAPIGDLLEPCGNTTGLIRANKKGDFLLTLGGDSVAAGAQIVIEAKEDASYTMKATLEEADEARRNRGAAVSLFVHSTKTAPPLAEPMSRHGHDIVVLWDAEDERSDVVLKCGLLLAKYMSVKASSRSKAESASFTALDKAIEALGKQLAGFEEIRTSAETIKRGGMKIEDRARIMSEELSRQIGIVSDQVGKLKQVLPVADGQPDGAS